MDSLASETLLESLIHRARLEPEGEAILILEDGTTERLTNSMFLEKSVQFSGALRRAGINDGDLVVLVISQLKELLCAFMGTLGAGAIPTIFPYLTPKLDPDIYRNQVKTLVSLEQARAVITFPDFVGKMQELLEDTGCVVLSYADGMGSEGETGLENEGFRSLKGDHTAFLQFSSGTTAMPKGILFSHQVVMDHLRQLAEAFGVTDQDVVVTWLPMYHDMGLITGFLLPLACGARMVMFSPFQWLRDPKSLLWAVHQYRGTISWMPNFAFNLIANSVRERDLAGLDLSSWRILGNGSEPVRLDSLEMVAHKFASYGFHPEALMAGYGLAELVTAASVTPGGQFPRVDWISRKEMETNRRAAPVEPRSEGSAPIVSCGYPLSGTEIRILDEAGRPLPDRQIGQVAIRSRSNFSGYYRQPDLKEQVVRDGWLLSGDMGYLLDGQVYLCGRIKEMIIIGGRNIFPQDVEEIANTTQGVYPGRVAAFGISDERLGTEALVLVCELREQVDDAARPELDRTLRRRVWQEMNATLADLRFVERGWVVKTSNGKIAHASNRQKYLEMVKRQT